MTAMGQLRTPHTALPQVRIRVVFVRFTPLSGPMAGLYVESGVDPLPSYLVLRLRPDIALRRVGLTLSYKPFSFSDLVGGHILG